MKTITLNPLYRYWEGNTKKLLGLTKNNRLKSLLLFLIIIATSTAFTQNVVMDKSGLAPMSMKFDKQAQHPVSSFFEEYRKTYPLSEDNQMQLTRSKSTDYGTYHRYSQYYKGIEVADAQYVLQEKDGKVAYANGYMIHEIDLDVTPTLTERQALDIALQDVNAQSYMWEYEGNNDYANHLTGDDHGFNPEGELQITSGIEEMRSENMHLVWRFEIYANEPHERWIMDIDATTGEIINKVSGLCTTDVPASGNTHYNGVVSFTADDAGTNFRLRETTTRDAEIMTFDKQNGTKFYDSTGRADIYANTADGPWDASGAQVHWGTEHTYDYFYDNHGLNGLDGEGYPLHSFVHVNTAFNNAFWNGKWMSYGDGDGIDYSDFGALDVVGHEIGHGVTHFSSRLIYQGESGAISESVSDIFGTLIEFQAEGLPGVGTGDWLLAEDITLGKGGIRDMSKPKLSGWATFLRGPDTYNGQYWKSTIAAYDNGGVHFNSGVGNYWFYLLAEGDGGTNDDGFSYNITPIGLEKAADIAFLSNDSYLVRRSSYQFWRYASIAAAEELYGVNSTEAIAVADAWDAVGVYDPNQCSVEYTSPASVGGTDATISIDPWVDGSGPYYVYIDGKLMWEDECFDGQSENGWWRGEEIQCRYDAGGFQGYSAGYHTVELRKQRVVNNKYRPGDVFCFSRFYIPDYTPPLSCGEPIVSNPTVFEGSDGSVEISWSDGVAPFDVTFAGNTSTDETSPYTVSGLSAGTFAWSVTDATSASCGGTVTLENPPDDPLICQDATFTDPSCHGDTDGSITLSWMGGSGVITVTFGDETYDNPPSPLTIKNLGAGTYSYTIADDATSCSESETLTEPAEVFADAGEDVDVIYGFRNNIYNCVTLTGSGSGGTGALSYEWSTGETTASIDVCPGARDKIYTLTVTDANGCSASDDVTVNVEIIICGKNADSLDYHKVFMCHNQSGNKPRTICVDTNSVQTHLDHGDKIGLCEFSESLAYATETTLTTYPNPSAGDVHINFSVEYDMYVNVTVYDMTGRQLEVMFNDTAISGKIYQLETVLTNGLKLVVMQTASGEVTTKKVIVR